MARPWRLRGFVLERMLGAGGTGEVWRARVAATGETVALKRVRHVPERHRRHVETEAAMLRDLEHPNLIRLLGVVRDGDATVLVLDLAEGGSLADVLAARGRLCPGEVVTALTPIASALAYAHARGVVHGDVSPGNVLFTAGGVPLLADLGIAGVIGAHGPGGRDGVGGPGGVTGADRADRGAGCEGSPGYVDPAVALGCLPSPASDVFMLGGVALRALTGRPTWTGATAAEALAAARAAARTAARGWPGEGDAVPLADIAACLADADVPPAMAAAVARALSRDALARGSAEDFAIDLRASARPVAVELRGGSAAERRVAMVRAARAAATGGRGRTGGGRHAAGPDRAVGHHLPDGGGPRTPPVASPLRSGGSVPSIAEAWRDPPTQSVACRPRPVLPSRRRLVIARRRSGARVPRRLRPASRPPGGILAWVTIAAVAALAAVLVAVTAPGRSVAAGPAAGLTTSTAAGTAAATVTTVGRSEPPSQPASPRLRTSPPTSASHPTQRAPSVQPARSPWAAVLARLDAVRGRAFATRRPDLLGAVYASPTLLAADRRLLLRTVPPGCRLLGVRTEFRRVLAVPPTAPGAASRAGVVAIRALAAIPPSRLVCGTQVRAVAPAVGATELRLELVRTRTGPRIARESQ